MRPMHMVSKSAVSLALFAGLAAPAAARPVVIELFTSEGCSSCPPADALLTELATGHGEVLPLAFHITYWDNLGWRDPFSLGAATDRQRYYARVLGSDTIYTPQAIVDGRNDVVGSNRSAMFAALRDAAAGGSPEVAVRMSQSGKALAIEVGEGHGEATLVLIGFDAVHRTHVGRGENAGRSLVESNIVRSITPLGSWHGAALAIQHDAPAGERFAAIVQSPDGRILGAAALVPGAGS